MSVEQLMMSINERSTSFFDSVARGSGPVSSICFRDMVKAAVATVKNRLDQELIMFVYLEEGDLNQIQAKIFDMVYQEAQKNRIIMNQVEKIKTAKTASSFFRSSRNMDDMLRRVAFLSLIAAIGRKQPSSRIAANFVKCGKDAYIEKFKGITATVSDEIGNRLMRSENQIKKTIYEKS
jgi:hypothetical protein